MSKEKDSISLERLCDLISEQIENAQDIVVVRENLFQIHSWIAHDKYKRITKLIREL